MPLIDGFIDGRTNDWRNRIAGPDHGIPLSKSRGKKVIHVGPHRTGATFLQKEVFPKYDEAKLVFSDDVICGRMFDHGIDNFEKMRDFLGEDLEIIVVLRNQPSMINSAYRTYIKAGGVWNYIRYSQEIIKNDKYNYANILNKIFELFKKDKCHVFFYEDLSRNPNEFISSILSLIGVSKMKVHDYNPTNPGPTIYFNEAIRLLNNCLATVEGILTLNFGKQVQLNVKRSLSWRVRGLALRYGIVLDNRIVKPLLGSNSGGHQFGYDMATKAITRHYADSNALLQTMTDRDLHALGYPLRIGPRQEDLARRVNFGEGNESA